MSKLSSSNQLDLLLESVGGDADRALRAFAILRPSACAHWLLSLSEPSTGNANVAEVINEIARHLPPGSTDDRELLLPLLRRYWRLLRPEFLAAQVSRLHVGGHFEGLEALIAEALMVHPTSAPLLRLALPSMASDRHGAEAVLSQLGLVDPSPATMTYIRSIRQQPGGAVGGTRARIALLSSYTVEPVVPYLDFECRLLSITPEIYVAPFNTWTQEIIDRDSRLYKFSPDAVILGLGLDDLVPDLSSAPGVDFLAAAEQELLARVVQAVSLYRSRSGAAMLVHEFHSAFLDPLGILGRGSRRIWISELNAKLRKELEQYPSTYLIDVAALSPTTGPNDNPKLRLLASMRLPTASLSRLAREYTRHIAPLKGLTRKCVVLDLDNTLWGGVIGEDGMDGIQLGLTSPGAEYVEFQRWLATLRRRGILLAVASKNNPADALEVIRQHEAMVLRERDFSAIQISWDPKPNAVRAVAAELNIGLDSLIFVDDNPDERELMRQVLPQVLTVDLPRDPARFRITLEALPQLEVLAVTAEDESRVDQYASKRQREQIRLSTVSLEEYLHSLGIRVRAFPLKSEHVARAAQLYQRTNQFNTTTRRHDQARLTSLIDNPDYLLTMVYAGDRFGDHGMVATSLVRRNGPEWVLDSLLMSCRVIGYGIETSLLAYICEVAQLAGAATLIGEFVPSAKNQPARDLFERHGFHPTSDVNGLQLWTLDLSRPIQWPPWVHRES